MSVTIPTFRSLRTAIVLAALVTTSGSLALAAPPAKGGAAAPAAAATSSKAACLGAHEQAQTLKTEKKLHAAREKFVVCARAECPVVLRKECTEQLEQMESVAPTVALEALDEKGGSDAQVKVSLDGQVVAERLTGSALPVEPGEHLFVFERASDGKKIEQKVMIVEGEKNRKVVADYQVPKTVPATPASAAPAGAERKIPVLAYVAGGVAVLGLGSFAVFSLSGRSAESDLASTCAPRCAESEVSDIKRDYVIADVSLGVAIFAAAAAVVLALPAFGSHPAPATPAAAPWMPRVRLRPLR